MTQLGWLTKKQAADYASVSVGDIERWMKNGLPCSRPSHKCARFHPKLIDKFLLNFLQTQATVEELADEILAEMEDL